MDGFLDFRLVIGESIGGEWFLVFGGEPERYVLRVLLADNLHANRLRVALLCSFFVLVEIVACSSALRSREQHPWLLATISALFFSLSFLLPLIVVRITGKTLFLQSNPFPRPPSLCLVHPLLTPNQILLRMGGCFLFLD